MTPRKTAPKAKSGSPPPGEPEYLLVGLLRRPHGLLGDVVMEVVTDFPDRLTTGTSVFIGAEHRDCRIAASRRHAEGLLIRFDGFTSPEHAGRLRNQPVFVSAADRPALPAGTYYHHKLLGLQVLDERGVSIGSLREILQTGANDVFVVGGTGTSELLLPAIDSVILEIDMLKSRIRVRVPDGLVPEPVKAAVRQASRVKKRHARP